MILKLNTTIAAIKVEFARIFPGLRLEFFSEAHDIGFGSSEEKKLSDQTIFSAGSISINPYDSVAEFEQQMKRKNMHIQVYRKSNDLWLQTSKTDHWSLAEQNRKGINSTQE